MKYHNDYSPRYAKPFDIYEKAKQQAKKIKKDEKKKGETKLEKV